MGRNSRLFIPKYYVLNHLMAVSFIDVKPMCVIQGTEPAVAFSSHGKEYLHAISVSNEQLAEKKRK